MTPLEEATSTAMKFANGIVFRAVGFHDDDLAQEAREAIWLASRSWREGVGSNPLTWLENKARWRVIDAYRERTGRRRVGPRFRLETTDGLPEELLGEEDDSADTVCARDLLLASLAQVLDRMSERDRRIIAGWLADMPQVEIANALGMNETRVSQIVTSFRAKSARHLSRAS